MSRARFVSIVTSPQYKMLITHWTPKRFLKLSFPSLLNDHVEPSSKSPQVSKAFKKNLTPFQLQQLPQFQDFLTSELNCSFDEFLSITMENGGALLNCHLSAVKTRVAYLQTTYLIKSEHLKYILRCHPKWLTRPTEEIDALFNCFLDNQVSFTDLGAVLSQNPSLLLFTKEQIAGRMEVFDDNYFTKNEKRKLLLNSENVLNKPPEVLRRIYSYLKETFNMTHEEMMISNAFSYSYRHLYCRLEFMRRRGLYIGRDKRGIFPANKQPHPMKIIKFPENKFLQQVALSTVEEYKSFCSSLPPSVLKELKLYDNFEVQEKQNVDDQDNEDSERETSSGSWDYLKTKYHMA